MDNFYELTKTEDLCIWHMGNGVRDIRSIIILRDKAIELLNDPYKSEKAKKIYLDYIEWAEKKLA